LLRQSFLLAWMTGSAFGAGFGVLLWVGLGSLFEALGLEQASPILPFLVGAAFGAPFGSWPRLSDSHSSFPWALFSPKAQSSYPAHSSSR